MKKCLFTTFVFMGITFLAAAQEKAAKSSNEIDIEKTKTEKAAYEKKIAEKKVIQKSETDKNDAQKLEMQPLDESIRLNKGLEKQDKIQTISNSETELSPAPSESLSTDMKEVSVEKKSGTEQTKAKTPAKEKSKTTGNSKTNKAIKQ